MVIVSRPRLRLDLVSRTIALSWPHLDPVRRRHSSAVVIRAICAASRDFGQYGHEDDRIIGAVVADRSTLIVFCRFARDI